MNEMLKTQAQKTYSDCLNRVLLDHRSEINNLKAQLLAARLLALSALILALSLIQF